MEKKEGFSENALRILKSRYFMKNEKGELLEKTPSQLFKRISDFIASAEKNERLKKLWSKKFFEMVMRRDFMPNSPTLTGAGRDMCLSACFVLPIEDSLASIFETVKNAALVHKEGGGTGFDFSRLRPKGSFVKKTQGIASGPISFLKVIDAATEAVKQGGTRRGANMGILRVDHPDIEEFVLLKRDGRTLTNFNISVAITEKFMKALKNNENYEIFNPYTQSVVGEKSASQIMDMIVDSAWAIGDPGIVFIDRINELNPTRELGEIRATNPCVVGSTLISTERGLERMRDLVEKHPYGGIRIAVDKRVPIEIMDRNGTVRVISSSLPGVNFNSISKAFLTGIRDVYKLKTKDGYEIIATPDHKIMTTEGWIPLKDSLHKKILLQSGEGRFNSDPLLPFKVENMHRGKNGRKYVFNFPTIWSKELGQILGWLIADGWIIEDGKNRRVGFSFGNDDIEALNYLKPILNRYYGKEIREIRRKNNTIHLSYHSRYFVNFFESLGVKKEKRVPESIFTAPKYAVIGFLQALFTADGTVRDNRKSSSDRVAISSKNKELLKDVQVLLLNLGIRSVLFDRSRPPRNGVFEYVTKRGKKKTYVSDGVLYELGIFGANLERFREDIGFMCQRKMERLKNIRFRERRYEDFTDEVVSIEYVGKEEVYDLTEPISHSMICNSLVVHQCGEQPLHDYESCNLGSINLSNFWNEEKKEFEWDKFAEIIKYGVRFLDNVIEVNKFPLPMIKEMTMANRRIGLGVMGFADLLIKMKIKYDSEEALEWAEKIAKFLREKAEEGSRELAEERGNFPNIEKSIYKGGKMRNATLITIAPTGTISRIAGCSSSIEPVFAFEMISKIIDSEIKDLHPLYKKWKDENPDAPLPPYFVTAHEIEPEWHLRMQAAFQAYTDNAVSKTINFPNSATREDIKKAYLLAYDLGVKGVTVYRDGCRAEQVLYKVEEKERPAPMERPDSLFSVTDKIKTGLGNMYVTISFYDNKPFEVFASIGKSGYSTMADAEAIGRLISLCLRSGIDPKEVINQLKGIGGSEPIFHHGHLVQSIPDAIAQVLERHVGKVNLNQKDLNSSKCPVCGAQLPDERCPVCPSCGWTKCV